METLSLEAPELLDGASWCLQIELGVFHVVGSFGIYLFLEESVTTIDEGKFEFHKSDSKKRVV